jgi:hypothetical protein
MRAPFIALLGLLAVSLPAAAQPSLTFSLAQMYHGEIVHIRGTGFTPNGDLLSHLIRPDGTEYPETPFKADAQGTMTHEITIVPNTFGTYELLVEDLATKTSASQRFLMVPHGFAPAVKTQADRLPAEYMGVWEGRVAGPAAGPNGPAQRDVPGAGDTTVTLSGGRVGAVAGTVAYPALLCGGEVWLVSATKERVQLGEVITYGQERCTGRALVTMGAPQKGAAAYEWHDIMDRGTAQGTLKRRD